MKTIASRQIQAILLPIVLLAIFFAAMAWIQFSTPDMPDNDGFYHIKLAYLMRTEGLKPDFKWLPLSILNEEEFYDHHFLFHVALIPFTFSDLRLGAKWAAVTFASLAFLAVWLLLQRQKVPLAWLWALGLLGISQAFLFRMSITRAQSLSLGVLALGMMWLLEGRYKLLALLSFFYVWMYDAFPLMGVFAVLHLIAVLLVERRLDLRPVIYVGVGTALGMIINPYFPDNITFFINHVMPKLTDATAVSVGNEWFPYDTGQLLDNSLPSLVIFALGAVALGLSGRKMTVNTAFALLAALLFGRMLFEARRFVEYFPPFALIFTAFAFSPLLLDFEAARVARAESTPRRVWLWYLPAAVMLLFVAATAYRSMPDAAEAVASSKPYQLYAGASVWLAQNTSEGERVFQTDWDDFPRLFYFNTHNTYLIGLDPTYMQLYDAEMYDLWVNITHGSVPNMSQVILEQFGSRHVVTDLEHGGFLREAARDPGMKEVYRDDQSAVFEIIEPSAQRESQVISSSPLECEGDPPPAHLPEDGQWIKFSDNPVLGGELGTVFDVSVLKEKDVFRMWVSWRPEASIALVESCDGVHWTEPVIVLGPNEASGWEDRVNRPLVLHQPDGYHMWYTGQTKQKSYIGHAISPDGLNWTRPSDQPVLSPDQPWEKDAVMVPHVMWDEGEGLYKMWYSGGGQQEPDAIGYALSPDGQTWSKRPDPVFAPVAGNEWESEKATAGQVICYDGWYVMFYIGFRDPDHAQIGLARSPDGINAWERHPANPIIQPGEAGSWDSDAVYKPFALFDDDRWYLWFNGRQGKFEQIGLVLHEGADLGFGDRGQVLNQKGCGDAGG
ncbi:MAG: hypothetical protein AB1649_22505 [Chloroflexota bacterium]